MGFGMPKILRPFDPDEEAQILAGLSLLASQLAAIPGSNVEEYHWAAIYRTAMGVPPAGWSNLPFKDYLHVGVGVEWKLLKRDSPARDQGRLVMHPAASRTIAFDPNTSAEEAKDVVLTQWASTIANFKRDVASTSPDGTADLRFGILLWRPDYREFLYFEEEVVPPRPQDFTAEWATRSHRGVPRKNLWIYERATGIKRYSVTQPEKGAKIQPYFDVPTVEEGAYLFRVSDDKLRQPVFLSKELLEQLGMLAAAPQQQESILRRHLGLD